MIRFSCPECGQKLVVKSKFAGKSSTCPKCKSGLSIPVQEPLISLDFDSNPAFEMDENGTVYTKEEKTPVPEILLLKQKELEEKERIEKELCTRKHPAILDVFMYPFNEGSMTFFAALMIIPILFLIFMGLLFTAAYAMPALIVFIVAIAVIMAWISIPLTMYYIWYFTECVRDSAEGHVRAPETIATTPDFFQLLGRYILVFAAFAVPFLPFSSYLLKSGGQLNGPEFVLTYLIGAFLSPIMLLSVSYFGNLSGLNIFRIMVALFKTFFSYLILIGVLILWTLVVATIVVVLNSIPLLASFLALPAGLYLGLVYAHILGRFYYLNRDKLNWEY